LISCWGDDLVWTTVLVGVKTCCIDVECCTGAVCTGIPNVCYCSGAVCTGIPNIGCWADLWGGAKVGLWGGMRALFSVGMNIWAWAGLILTLSKALLSWLK
jgi:hypothetical protein